MGRLAPGGSQPQAGSLNGDTLNHENTLSQPREISGVDDYEALGVLATIEVGGMKGRVPVDALGGPRLARHGNQFELKPFYLRVGSLIEAEEEGVWPASGIDIPVC